MTSLDFFDHSYASKCLKFTKDRYGDKFNYIVGDSKDTLDSLIKDSKVYDLIFIDGCHEYSGVKSDLDRCLKLCHENTVIIMDDLVPFKKWGKDVVKIWNEYIENNKIIPLNVVGEVGEGDNRYRFSSNNPLFSLYSSNHVEYDNVDLRNFNSNECCRRWGVLKRNFEGRTVIKNLLLIINLL